MGELISFFLLSVFAVFGLYCAVRLLWESHYVPKGMQISLTLLSRDDVRALPDLLREIYSRLSVPDGDLLVLIPELLYSDPAVREELDVFLTGYGAEVLLFSPISENPT